MRQVNEVIAMKNRTNVTKEKRPFISRNGVEDGKCDHPRRNGFFFLFCIQNYAKWVWMDAIFLAPFCFIFFPLFSFPVLLLLCKRLRFFMMLWRRHEFHFDTGLIWCANNMHSTHFEHKWMVWAAERKTWDERWKKLCFDDCTKLWVI